MSKTDVVQWIFIAALFIWCVMLSKWTHAATDMFHTVHEILKERLK